MLTGSTDRRTNLVDHTFCDARLNRHSLKRILAGRRYRNPKLQVRAADLDRVVQKSDLLPGLGSLPPQYRQLSPLQMEILGIGIIVEASSAFQLDTIVGKKK